MIKFANFEFTFAIRDPKLARGGEECKISRHKIIVFVLVLQLLVDYTIHLVWQRTGLASCKWEYVKCKNLITLMIIGLLFNPIPLVA